MSTHQPKRAIIHSTMRDAGFWEKVFTRLRSPLASVPECAHMASMSESLRHGYMAPSYRVIAENLVFAVQYTVHASVEGDIAEFGVQTGRTAAAITAAMKLVRASKNAHFFDSFEGLPEATSKVDLENVHVKTGVWGKGALKGITPHLLRQKCSRFIADESIKIYRGWFSSTLTQIPAGTTFCMLHVDCDLYSSTFEVLEFMVKTRSLSPGAIILFDDWQCNQASNEHGERKAWRDLCGLYDIEYSDLGAYGWAGQKFIVHRYSPKNR